MRKALPVCLVTLAGCAGRTEAAPPRPNVLLIVIDTLRADRLSFLGCARENAPFLASLAQEGLVFENARSAGPWTVPGTASLMTSLYPFQHGLVDGFDIWAAEDEIAESLVNRLPDEIETIPELFQALGYRTFGVSANRLVGFEMGFDGGFERFVSVRDLDAAAVNAHVLDWLRPVLDGADERPWFVYLHYFDPHDNYQQREPWYDVDGLEAPDEESASRFARFRAEIRREEEEDPEYAQELADRSAHMVEFEEGTRPQEPARAAIDRMLAAYDSEIRYLDGHLRDLFSELGDLDDTVVVVTSDHGEEFLDHGAFGHGGNLHDEVLRVPLLLRLPGENRPRGRVAENVSTMDLLPTFRALLDLPHSPRDQGRSLLGARARDRLVCSVRLDWPGPTSDDFDDPDARSEEFSAVSGREKVIFSDTRDHSEYRLFDLAQDPGERRSLAGERPARVLELRAAVDRLAHDLPRWERHFESARIDQSIRAHMAGIGYAGKDE